MESNNLDPKPRILAKIVIQFLLVAAVGTMFIYTFLILYWKFTPGANPVQIIVSVLIASTCGVISAVWGDKGLNWLLRVFESV